MGRIADVPGKEHGVGEIDRTILIYIAEGNVAVVGKNNRRISAVQQHIQHIGAIDLAIVVHIPQNTVRNALHTRNALVPFDHNRGSINPHSKDRGHIRD